MVAASFKQKNVIVCYSPIFARQAAIGTALAAAGLTAQLPLARDAKPLPSRRITREEERECRGRFLTGRRITSRLATWQLSMDASPALVYGFLALAMGASAEATGAQAPFTHEATHGTSDQVPATSFIVAAEDSDEQPAELYKDMVVNTVEITGEVRGKVRLTVGFIGSADVDDVVGFVAPDCPAVLPVYANDCLLTIDGVNRTEDLRSFAYNFGNNILSNDDPFPFSSIDVQRLERGDETSAFRLALYGTAAHPVYAAALAEEVVPVSLRIGGAASHALISAAAGLALQDTPIGYAGEANRSVINLDATPFSVGGNDPDSVTGVLATGTQFLTVPV